MTPEAVRFLIKAGIQAPSADNCQPWRFHWDGMRLTISYDRQRLHGHLLDANSPATLLAVGAAIENITQAAEVAGIPFELSINPASYETEDYAVVDLDPGATVSPEAWSHALFNRHTNRHPYRTDPLPKSLLQEIAAMDEVEAQVSLLQEREDIKHMAGLARMASRVRFRTREIHEWFGDCFRFTADEVATGDGLDIATLDLPPGGRMLLHFTKSWRVMNMLNRVGLYRFFALVEARLLLHSPCLVLIHGPAESDTSLAAGRLMERIWLRLTQENIAVQPYFVVSDQLHRLETGKVPVHLLDDVRQLASEWISWRGGQGNTLHMLLRIGYPRQHPVLSKRLPMAVVCPGLD